MTLTDGELGANLRKARKAVGLTQAQAESLVGLHRLVILKIEKGKRPVTALELLRFERAYGASLSELLSTRGPRPLNLIVCDVQEGSFE